MKSLHVPFPVVVFLCFVCSNVLFQCYLVGKFAKYYSVPFKSIYWIDILLVNKRVAHLLVTKILIYKLFSVNC